MTEVVLLETKILNAMKAHFITSIERSSGMPFGQTGVTMPSDDVWKGYADAVYDVVDEDERQNLGLDWGSET